jgi:flagellin
VITLRAKIYFKKIYNDWNFKTFFKKMQKDLKDSDFASLLKSRSLNMEITMAISVTLKPGVVLGASASNTNRNFTENPLDRLSNGRSFYSRADDAAGLAVLSKLEAALSEKEQAIRNAADVQGLLHTADAGAAEVSNILKRMRELAIQAAKGIKSIAEREALQNEADQLTAEISRIADSTSFNGNAPLSGSEMDFKVSASADEQIKITVDGVNASDLQLDRGRISIDTSQAAQKAVGVIDAASQKLNSIRSDIGANLDRISSSIDHLSEVAKNKKIAAGRASDADVENERIRLTKSQMLQKSSIAMLAQGNASKRVMLQFIS